MHSETRIGNLSVSGNADYYDEGNQSAVPTRSYSSSSMRITQNSVDYKEYNRELTFADLYFTLFKFSSTNSLNSSLKIASLRSRSSLCSFRMPRFSSALMTWFSFRMRTAFIRR